MKYDSYVSSSSPGGGIGGEVLFFNSVALLVDLQITVDDHIAVPRTWLWYTNRCAIILRWEHGASSPAARLLHPIYCHVVIDYVGVDNERVANDNAVVRATERRLLMAERPSSNDNALQASWHCSNLSDCLRSGQWSIFGENNGTCLLMKDCYASLRHSVDLPHCTIQ